MFDLTTHPGGTISIARIPQRATVEGDLPAVMAAARLSAALPRWSPH